jgi:hypothetical protein
MLEQGEVARQRRGMREQAVRLAATGDIGIIEVEDYEDECARWGTTKETSTCIDSFAAEGIK